VTAAKPAAPLTWRIGVFVASKIAQKRGLAPGVFLRSVTPPPPGGCVRSDPPPGGRGYLPAPKHLLACIPSPFRGVQPHSPDPGHLVLGCQGPRGPWVVSPRFLKTLLVLISVVLDFHGSCYTFPSIGGKKDFVTIPKNLFIRRQREDASPYSAYRFYETRVRT